MHVPCLMCRPTHIQPRFIIRAKGQSSSWARPWWYLPTPELEWMEATQEEEHDCRWGNYL